MKPMETPFPERKVPEYGRGGLAKAIEYALYVPMYPRQDSNSSTNYRQKQQQDNNRGTKSGTLGGKPAIDSQAGDGFAAALAMIARLPLTDTEKAEAVRRLLTGRENEDKPQE